MMQGSRSGIAVLQGGEDVNGISLLAMIPPFHKCVPFRNGRISDFYLHPSGKSGELPWLSIIMKISPFFSPILVHPLFS